MPSDSTVQVENIATILLFSSSFFHLFASEFDTAHFDYKLSFIEIWFDSEQKFFRFFIFCDQDCDEVSDEERVSHRNRKMKIPKINKTNQIFHVNGEEARESPPVANDNRF